MKNLPTYSAWLKLTEGEKEKLKATWCANLGEGESIVLRAARRFKKASKDEVLSVDRGVYHGGEWLIHAYTRPSVLKRTARRTLKESFEGFRVYWTLHDSFRADVDVVIHAGDEGIAITDIKAVRGLIREGCKLWNVDTWTDPGERKAFVRFCFERPDR